MNGYAAGSYGEVVIVVTENGGQRTIGRIVLDSLDTLTNGDVFHDVGTYPMTIKGIQV